jgi:hypothetical protein
MNREVDALRALSGRKIGKREVDLLKRELDAGNPAATKVLRELILLKHLPDWIRAALVTRMIAAPTEDREELLLALLSEGEPDIVRGRACQVLSQVGSRDALPTLAALATTAGVEWLGRVAVFAHALICHREHIQSELFALPSLDEGILPRGPAVVFSSQAAPPEMRAQVAEDIRHDFYQLGAFGAGGLQITCAAGCRVFLPLEASTADGYSAVLRRFPVVIGVVALWSEEHQRWSLARIVVGGPLDGGEFYVAIFRRDGVLDLWGTGIVDERLTDLRAARRPGGNSVVARAYWYGSNLVVAGIADLIAVPSMQPVPASRSKNG